MSEQKEKELQELEIKLAVEKYLSERKKQSYFWIGLTILSSLGCIGLIFSTIKTAAIQAAEKAAITRIEESSRINDAMGDQLDKSVSLITNEYGNAMKTMGERYNAMEDIKKSNVRLMESIQKEYDSLKNKSDDLTDLESKIQKSKEEINEISERINKLLNTFKVLNEEEAVNTLKTLSSIVGIAQKNGVVGLLKNFQEQLLYVREDCDLALKIIHDLATQRKYPELDELNPYNRYDQYDNWMYRGPLDFEPPYIEKSIEDILGSEQFKELENKLSEKQDVKVPQ